MNGSPSLNRRVSARELRRQLANEAINNQAALHNEALTRKRVEELEQMLDDQATLVEDMAKAMESFVHMTLWKRLRWLLSGRVA